MSNPSPETRQAARLKRAMAALDKMQSKLAAVERAKREPIAIIGMACRLPGGVNTPEAYWDLLQEGRSGISDIPASRWRLDDHFNSDPGVGGKMYVRRGGFIDQLHDFDSAFFGIAPREAARMDPQQKLVLETGWEALERAGIAPDSLVNSNTGVYIAIAGIDAVIDIFSDTSAVDPYMGTGSVHSITSGRLSYVLGLRGPCMGVDTACSSSILAHHIAVKALRTRECDMAMVGGVNMIHRPELNLTFCRGNMLAPDGRCKTFDDGADGYVRSEGCGMFVLKRLSDAQAAGDPVLAVIRGSAINHDGVTSGLTVPNGPSQQEVIRTALKQSGLNPEDIGCIEAHGTGTPLGDPIELGALHGVFSPGREKPLYVGSAKTNIGHLEAGAGAAGMMKAVLALNHGVIPKHLNYEHPTTRFPWSESALKVPTETQDWPEDLPRTMGVSAFSFSGTNAHIILEAPPTQEAQAEETQTAQAPALLTLSARDKTALQHLAGRYGEALRDDTVTLSDVAFTANTGRAHMRHRLAVSAADKETIIRRLERFSTSGETRAAAYGSFEKRGRSAFIYPGQGMQYAGMGAGLYQTEPVFRDMMNTCAELARPYMDRPLLDLIYPPKGVDPRLISETIYTQPALYALGVSLANLWYSRGVKPDAYFGQSMGELTAAHLAGVFSLEDGMKLAAERGRLMDSLPRNGLMASIGANEGEVAEVVDDYSRVSIAAVNGAYGVVISGLHEEVSTVCEIFNNRNIKVSKLDVSIASHCPLMEPIADAYHKVASTVNFHPPKAPLIADLTGDWADVDIATPDYWVRHILEPVRFADGIRTLYDKGTHIFVENGPTPLLLAMAREILGDDRLALVSPLRKEEDNNQTWTEAAAELHVNGVDLDWRAWHTDQTGKRIVLPTYPFQRKQEWVKSRADFVGGSGGAVHPLVDRRLELPGLNYKVYESLFRTGVRPDLDDHRVYGLDVVSGAALLCAVHGAAADLTGRQTLRFSQVRFLQALVIPEDDVLKVHIMFKPQDAGFSFRVISFSDGDAEHVRHVDGLVAKLNVRPEGERFQMTGESRLPGEELYRNQGRKGVELGDSYQWLDLYHLTGGGAEGVFTTPAANQVDRWTPGLIDSSFQLLIAALEERSQATWAPAAIGEIHFYGSPQAKTMGEARVEHLNEEDGDFTGNITLYDESGDQLLSFRDMVGHRIERDTFVQAFAPQIKQRLFNIVWKEAPAASPTEAPTRSWLVLADAQGMAERWMAKAQARGDQCTPVWIGEHFSAHDSGFTLNPDHPNQLARVFDALEQPPTGLAHFWALDVDASNTPQSMLDTLPMPVLHIMQKADESQGLSALHLFTRGSVEAGGQGLDDLGQTAGALLWGLGRSLALEHPELDLRLIDLDPEPETDVPDLSPRNDAERSVAYRDGVCLVARLNAITPPKKNTRTLDEDASYLITGGLGGLGLIAADRLVDMGARQLVLTSRSEPSREARAKLDALEAKGAHVIVRRADVSDPDAVEALKTWLQRECAPLRGLIHTAGVLQDGALLGQDPQRYMIPFQAKVKGAMNLHQSFGEMDLDFLILYSSATSVLGSAGQTNYAAANSFLDAMATMRRRSGKAALSISWGAWLSDGLADESVRARLAAMGLEPLAPEDALDDMQSLLYSGADHAAVLNADWDTYTASRESHDPFFDLLTAAATQSTENASVRDMLETAGNSDRTQLVLHYLQDQLSDIMGLDDDETPPPHSSLPSLGLDSLMSIRLKNRISSALGVTLKIVDFLKAPSLQVLAEDLARQSQPSGLVLGAPEQELPEDMEELVL